MTDSKLRDSIDRSLSLDRCDIFENSTQEYPESYKKFQSSIENIFFKSELLLKCKFEFERLIIIDLPETLKGTELLNKDLNLSLIFTGAIKSGRSSLINMLLNTKVMPTNIIGSSCCVHITHPKSGAKPISVGVHDLDGWEVDKYMDLDISNLPKKIETLQYLLAKKSCEKNDKYSKRIQVQLPHWLLKNINIYECPAIDGIYSFEEPFDIIEKVNHRILVHVIDASNGLMQWDRTFLAKIQLKWPHLPIFFIINHVDIQPDTLARDRGLRFESVTDKCKMEHLESESSDHNSADETLSDKFFAGGFPIEDLILKQQTNLIEKTKKQLKKLGFMLENQSTTHYAALSVKEFTRLLSAKEEEKNCYWEFVDNFFVGFSDYLSTWLENLLITSSLELKSRVNGVVDAARCPIIYPNEILQDVSSDTYLQNIKKAQNKIKEEFNDINIEFDKQVTKSIKEQLKKHAEAIHKSLPDLFTEDNTEIIQIIKPQLLGSFEKILFGGIDQYNVNEEIIRIREGFYRRIESVFIKLYKPDKLLSFFEYILNLFRTLQRTLVYPLLLRLPDDVIQSDYKWYRDLLKNAARKILGTNAGHHNLVLELINDIKVGSIIRNTQVVLTDIKKQLQKFTKEYQEAYKMTRSWTLQKMNVSPEVFKKFLLVDFVIKVIEKSFQKQKNNIKFEDLVTLPSFHNEFYEHELNMIKCVNIQSFTVLSDAINILCVKRVYRQRQYIMIHKSTKLLDNGLCLLCYSKMEYDLLYGMTNKINWQKNDVVGIIKQLLNAAKCLMPYSQYLQIDFYPENIMLKKDKKGLHECLLFPFAAENPTISNNYLTKRKVTNIMNNVVSQLGMVLMWLLTNDMHVCEMLNGDEECSMKELQDHVTPIILDGLKQSTLINVAINFLFKSEEYNNMETVLKELDDV